MTYEVYTITTLADFRALTPEQRKRVIPDLLLWAECTDLMEKVGFVAEESLTWVDDDRPGEVSEITVEVRK